MYLAVLFVGAHVTTQIFVWQLTYYIYSILRMHLCRDYLACSNKQPSLIDELFNV